VLEAIVAVPGKFCHESLKPPTNNALPPRADLQPYLVGISVNKTRQALPPLPIASWVTAEGARPSTQLCSSERSPAYVSHWGLSRLRLFDSSSIRLRRSLCQPVMSSRSPDPEGGGRMED
jgi:hypothetical protein